MIAQTDKKRTRNGYSPSVEHEPRWWRAEKVSAFTYRSRHTLTGSELLIHTAYGRIFEVSSDSGETYGMCLLCCTCPDHENRAVEAGRYCRHAAAALAVEDLMRSEKTNRILAAAFREGNPQDLDARVERLQAETERRAEDREPWRRTVAVELELNPHLQGAA
jgi:hypothetical protein